jgi:hypothetical protein
VQQKTATYVRLGSEATLFSTEATRPFMSAMPPIAIVSVRRNEPSTSCPNRTFASSSCILTPAAKLVRH